MGLLPLLRPCGALLPAVRADVIPALGFTLGTLLNYHRLILGLFRLGPFHLGRFFFNGLRLGGLGCLLNDRLGLELNFRFIGT